MGAPHNEGPRALGFAFWCDNLQPGVQAVGATVEFAYVMLDIKRSRGGDRALRLRLIVRCHFSQGDLAAKSFFSSVVGFGGASSAVMNLLYWA